MPYRINLEGEVALVTGGSRNIGLAIAQALVDSGAKVCIWGRTNIEALDRALDALGGARESTSGRLVELPNEQAVMAGFDDIETHLGAVSILINNAASRPGEPFESMSLAAFSAVVEPILMGAFLTSRELFRRLPPGRRGAIVNIGGISAHRPGKGRAHVIAAKAGLVGLTRALAEEGIGRIRVNCVVPGAIATERMPDQATPRFLDEPGREAGRAVDVARAVLPFADPAASYVTGQTLHVSGGRFMP
jgi:3-oxoacyl-[acyl-carrier protein] reductase